MIGWKQAYTPDYRTTVLVKLEIPDDARLVRLSSGCYRCDHAKVLKITSMNGKREYSVVPSMKDGSFKYKVGAMVYSNADMSISYCEFCGDPAKEKGPGIYFFKTKKQAKEYEY